ncbi:iron complex outermembrane recepter protein [Arenibacter nanhaiticus]|uniref:Iron complex outermembrane recepter protein n=1 Tax=Arenibacter nanhaiticus TaxID=558155 RepID=A0A1M6EE96_9FLAO|nr:TonB-dependent receptor [Arenibacter nanhaiticus]SHI83640.1 iron complex outermembrane recepter protein [Arenibacter nanhaiticus]
MANNKTFLVVLMVFQVLALNAQSGNTIVLEEVILSDVKLLHFSNGIKVTVLKDSVIQRNGTSLTDLLQFNSTIYFKENGYGMISSPSFRGTNASQTAVVWNGININSQLSGQTDFNTISPQNYKDVVVRSGGGSVQFGSGAIGGSVHLNDTFLFQEHYYNQLVFGYGSFQTKNVTYKTAYGTDKWSLSLGANYKISENDYNYLGTDRKNENGAYNNLDVKATVGYFLSKAKVLKLYHNTFIGDRDFSGTITAAAKDHYKDVTSRSLLEWGNFNGHKISRVKLAYLYEKYRYYPNKEKSDFSYGSSNNLIFNYDYKYTVGNFIFNGIADFNVISAEGTNIENAHRNMFSGTFLLTHHLSEKFRYGVNIRKEVVNDYDSPLLFSMDTNYDVSDRYSINLNASKNYRIPTFNDLYWVGAGAIGNKEVTPESSFQAELGQHIKGEKYTLGLTAYYIISEDLIQWKPNDAGNWMPVNIKDAYNYGLEASLDLRQQWHIHQLSWKNLYAYSKSVDKDTNKQLIYVPFHKITSNIAYQYKAWELYHQLLYNGQVYTTSDNSDFLQGYVLSNIGVGRSFEIDKVISGKIGVKINNLFNKNYQNVAYRPMPNRNYQLNISIKF